MLAFIISIVSPPVKYVFCSVVRPGEAALKNFKLGKNAKEQASYDVFNKKVRNVLEKFTAVQSPKFKPVGISAFPPHFVSGGMGKSLLIRSMAPVSAEDLAIVNKLQDEIRRETGLNNFGAYKAHITLGYFISSLKNIDDYVKFREYFEHLDGYIKSISDDPKYHFTFPSIELCEFQNMEQYDTVENGSYPWVNTNITPLVRANSNSQKKLLQSH